MTQPIDLDINRGVRRIMIKHWVDLGRLSIRSMGGHVYLRGVLQRISGKMEELTAVLVDKIFYDVGRIPGVRSVRPHLDNWINDAGRWRSFQRHGAGAQEVEKDQSADRP